MFDKKMMFSAASSAGNGLVDILNPGSCVNTAALDLLKI